MPTRVLLLAQTICAGMMHDVMLECCRVDSNARLFQYLSTVRLDKNLRASSSQINPSHALASITFIKNKSLRDQLIHTVHILV